MVAPAAALSSTFEGVGCDGAVCVAELGGSGEICLDADRVVVAASTIKVLVALEIESQFATQRLDPVQPVTLAAEGRTLGPTGFSLFSDTVRASARDLVVAMMTISDNAATDAVLDLVGIDAVNARANSLGLQATVLETSMRDLLESIAVDVGFASFEAFSRAAATSSTSELAALEERLATSRALRAATANRTSARDMATLLRLIWTDRAGPPPACARVRDLMAQQLTRDRLAAGFTRAARVAAKSGGLMGIVRNEVGVITLSGDEVYLAAIFTSARKDAAGGREVNAAIGDVAATAVAALRSSRTGATKS